MSLMYAIRILLSDSSVQSRYPLLQRTQYAKRFYEIMNDEYRLMFWKIELQKKWIPCNVWILTYIGSTFKYIYYYKS